MKIWTSTKKNCELRVLGLYVVWLCEVVMADKRNSTWLTTFMANFRPWQVHMSKSVFKSVRGFVTTPIQTEECWKTPNKLRKPWEYKAMFVVYYCFQLNQWLELFAQRRKGKLSHKALIYAIFNKMKKFYNCALAKKKKKTLYLNLAKVWNISDPGAKQLSSLNLT